MKTSATYNSRAVFIINKDKILDMKIKVYFIALLTALILLPANSFAENMAKHKKEVCIQLYSLRSILDGVNKDGQVSESYTKLLNDLAKMGYTAVEAANYNDGKFYGRTPQQFKEDCAKAGLVALSSHTNRGLNDQELASGDFTEALKWWKQCIADHKAAGMKYIVCPWMNVPKNQKDLLTQCKYLNEIGKMCKESGIKFGYHNHSHEFQQVEGKKMYDIMLENTNPEYVFFQMDVFWTVWGQNSPVNYFKKYPGRFKMFHIKDYREIGQSGMVGYDAIFNNADKAGLENFVVELEQSENPSIVEGVRESINYLLNADFVKSSYSKDKK